MKTLILFSAILFAAGSFAKDIEVTTDITFSKFAEGYIPTGEIETYHRTQIYPNMQLWPSRDNEVEINERLNKKSHPFYLAVSGMRDKGYNGQMSVEFFFNDLKIISGKTYECVNDEVVYSYDPLPSNFCRVNLFSVRMDMNMPFVDGDKCLVKVTTTPDVVNLTFDFKGGQEDGHTLPRRFPFGVNEWLNERPLKVEFDCKSSRFPKTVLKGTFLHQAK